MDVAGIGLTVDSSAPIWWMASPRNYAIGQGL